MVSPKMVSLPRFGLGMAALGRPGYINLDRSAIFGEHDRSVEVMQSQANVVMDRLLELTNQSKDSSHAQVPWLDCARSYGLSEKFVGEYLRAHKVDPKDVYVSSKWGYTYVADWNVQLAKGEPHEVKDHSKDNFLKQLQETAEYLGEYVKLYQIHSATFESGILENIEAHKALAQCRAERGWAIGLSVSSPQQCDIIMQAMKLTVDGERLFDSVQCTYNVLEQRPHEALQEAHKAGLDIIIKEGLANGRALRHETVQKYAKEMGCEPDQLAIACILAQSFEPRVLSGAVTSDQLSSNWKALDVADKLRKDTALLSQIMEECKMDSEEYWKERSALAWN